MVKTVHAVLARLFQAEKPAAHLRPFSWHLIELRRRPFLLLPTTPASPRVGLALYSAHRRRAKILRAALPLVLKTPAAALFHRITLQVDVGSEFVRFLSDQSGVPVDLLPVPAIKFGGMERGASRLVLLASDLTNRPLKVIKLGMDAIGRAGTEHEADLLAMLPANTLGCIRPTGRLTTPNLFSFATDFFAGESPEDDLGMEILFHAWINPGPPVPLESLDTWRELDTDVAGAAPAEWQALRPTLAGRRLRTTLHHGDFAPWNIRAVNSRQLGAFDWERGRLQGIPAWDWFHFVVQTSILARRHSTERVAAELEELLASPRFQTYAEATGIRPILKPLVLAYLVHHLWVVKPRDGVARLQELSGLLSARWGFLPDCRRCGGSLSVRTQGVASPSLGFGADAWAQLKNAWFQLANVFWEPNLTAAAATPFLDQLKSAWPLILCCCGWLVGATVVQYVYTNHVMLLPIFAIPGLLAGWRINRRWGMFFAAAAASAGPVVSAVKDPASRPVDVTFWNILMRFVILQMSVFLADRIHRQEDFFYELATPAHRKPDFRRNWAIVAFSIVCFFLIAWGDIWTGPTVSFLPLYLFPAMLMTLFLNLGWGALTAVLAACVASVDEYASRYNVSVWKVFAWNLPMRFLMLFLVVLLLNRLRHDNVLFSSNGASRIFKPGDQAHAPQV